jgi:hypothetical protein
MPAPGERRHVRQVTYRLGEPVNSRDSVRE